MFYGRNLLEQARVFIRMANDCDDKHDDKHLAERLKAMAKSLEILAKDTKVAPAAGNFALADESELVRS